MNIKDAPISTVLLALALISSGFFQHEAGAVTLLPPGTKGMEACVNANSSTVVRIKIPVGFNTAAKLSRVKARDNDPAGEDSHGNPLGTTDSESRDFRRSRPLKLGLDEYRRNPYHFSMSQIDGLNKTQDYIKVRVYLEDSDYTFYTDKFQPGTPPINGVVHLDDSHAPNILKMFCQKYTHAIEDNDDNSVLTFYVKRLAKDATLPSEASVNLIIIPRQGQASSPEWGYETPVLIDPKIKNDG